MPKPERTSLTVSIPIDLEVQLRAEADRRVVAPSLLVAKALEHYLPTLLPVPGDGSEA